MKYQSVRTWCLTAQAGPLGAGLLDTPPERLGFAIALACGVRLLLCTLSSFALMLVRFDLSQENFLFAQASLLINELKSHFQVSLINIYKFCMCQQKETSSLLHALRAVYLYLYTFCRSVPSKRSQKVNQRMNLSLNPVRKKMSLKMVKKLYFIGVKRTYKE